MLRRPPTALSLTAEDIAAYEDMRAQKAAHEQEQQQQKHQPQQHGLHQRHLVPQSHHHHQQQQQPQLSRAAMLETSPAQSPSNRSSSADEAMADVADLSDEVDLEDDEDEDEDDDHEDSYYTQRAIRRAAAMDDPFVQPNRQQPSSRSAAGPASSMQTRGGTAAAGPGTARTLFTGQASRASRLQRITGTGTATAVAAADAGSAGTTGPGRGQAVSTRGAAAQPSMEAPGAPSRLMRSREERIGLSQPPAQAGSGLGSAAGGGAAAGARRR